MNPRWQAAQQRFAAVSRRERTMLAVAVLATAVFLVNLLWLSPALDARQAARQSFAQKSAEMTTLRAQKAALEQQAELERIQGEAALKALATDYAQVSAELGSLGRNLVAAREMPDFLRKLVPAGRSLEVVSLRTLAAEPLLPHSAGGDGQSAGTSVTATGDSAPVAANAVAEEGAAALANLYRHSVEIRLAGRYADLYAWLVALERAPKKVLWGDLRLEVEKYPISVMTLTVHTLSLDREWLSI